jgi:hypothetical protein
VVRQIARGDQVRVTSLTGAATDHVVVVTALRPPRVGDIGMVVDITGRLGGTGRHYTVACGEADAPQVWLAVFAAHELELVARA